MRNLSTSRLDVRSIKNKIQDKATKELSYFGENSQFYKKKLIPNFGNITIHKRGIVYLWDCNISTKFTNKFEFTVKISNGKINPSGSFRQKEVTCKNCQKFVVPLHKKVCSSCKLNLCFDCAKDKKIFPFFRRTYCPECMESEIKKI